MAVRRLAVLSAVLTFSAAGTAVAAEPVTPRAGVTLRGAIDFPRAQSMQVRTGAKDSRRLTVALGFHGRCKGGRLREVWSANIAAKQRLRVRDGRFGGTLTGVVKHLGGVSGRTGHFRWTVTGRFTERRVALATVTGTAEIRVAGETVSRCRTRKAASVRLAA